MMDKYKTVLKPAEIQLVEKKSTFIAKIIPAGTEKDTLAFLEETRIFHKKARHNCFGFILREKNIERYSDDGEPSGTAGLPILEVLKNQELFDVFCVVTRYFGGVLLGAGGLTRAYSKSAAMVVQQSEIITMETASALRIKAAYTYYGRIKSAVEKFGGTSENEVFSGHTEITAILRLSTVEDFSKHIVDSCNGAVSIEFERGLYYRFT
ncbi:MAG: YigZ family protein [Oscillospiraceae bacterium]|nr:YigZ family protein [Oscillospiraceae bacterium]